MPIGPVRTEFSNELGPGCGAGPAYAIYHKIDSMPRNTIISGALCASVAALFVACGVGIALLPNASQNTAGLTVDGSSSVFVEHADRNVPFAAPFRLTNQTQETIAIKRVHKGCSCVTTALDGESVPPGGSVVVDVSVSQFETFARTFDQTVTVETDHGDVSLRVAGKLPPPNKVLYRPQAMRINVSTGSGHWDAGTLILRVPKHCANGRGLSSNDVRITGVQATFSLTQGEVIGDYNEYCLEIVVDSAQKSTGQGELIIMTPCETLDVPIALVNE